MAKLTVKTKLTPEQERRERAKARRRENYAAKRADKLAEEAAAVEAPSRVEPKLLGGPGVAGGSKSPSAVATARENLTTAFDMMGGVPALVRWGRKNPTEFYRMWARLIPKEAVEPTSEMPLEKLLAMLATKSEKSVAEAAYEIGTETLTAARNQVSVEDAAEALRQQEGSTVQ